MKRRLIPILLAGLLTAGFILLTSSRSIDDGLVENPTNLIHSGPDEKLKKAAFEILKTKCNVCHKKQNPFMVFNEKNMVRRAPKIYRMVVVERKMPKGNDIRLTNEEFVLLEKWLLTQNIF